MDSTAMQALVDRLNQLNYHYYTLDEPLVSDGEYDQLYDQLLALEKETGIRLPDSPTLRVGGELLEEFKKHRHQAPLYSLAKSRSPGEIRAWIQRVDQGLAAWQADHPEETLAQALFLCELKFDGLTINLTYEKGYLTMASTRGNGQVGEEILDQVRTIRSVPLSIPYQGTLEVQGEGVMPLSSLAKYNARAEKPLKNARNAAAGALRNLDLRETAARRLDAYFYNVGFGGEENFSSEEEMLAFLRAQGFKVHPFLRPCKSEEEILAVLQEVETYRQQIDVLTDGVVIKLNDLRSRDILGFTAKFPRWAMAFKYEAEETSTILKEVEWNVGRTGKLTPTAILEPVELAGATVSRATLNNYDDILRKGVRLGGRVLVRRSNEVIPEILGAIEDPDYPGQAIEKPSHCPACASDLVQEKVHLYCPNSLSCRPQLNRRITHFASREAMNIEGLSEKTIDKLLDAGLSEMADLYQLKEEDLLKLDGFQQKKTENLLQALEASKQVDFAHFLNALGIPEVGVTTAQDLADHFSDFSALQEATAEELQELPDIGPVTADHMVEFFQDPHIQAALRHLLAQGIQISYPKKRQLGESFWRGKKIVITGTIPGWNRKDLEEALRKQGAEIRSSVSSKTDLVLSGLDPGSKRTKAEELSIPILEGEELLEKVADGKGQEG